MLLLGLEQIMGIVLPAKIDNDFMFCYKVIRNLESIDYLCINPILRKVLNTHMIYRFALAQVECDS